MKSDKTAKIPDGVTVIIGYSDEDLSGLEWNIGEWLRNIHISFDKGSKDFMRKAWKVNFFLFTKRHKRGRTIQSEIRYKSH